MAGESKLYEEPLYSISVAAKMLDLHPQTLRHYERRGLIQPGRTKGNNRLYSLRDIERLRKICRLVEDLGVNLAGVEVILNLLDRVDQLQQEMSAMQAEMEKQITSLRQRLREAGLDS